VLVVLVGVLFLSIYLDRDGRHGSDATAGAANSAVQKAGEVLTAAKDTVAGGAGKAARQAAASLRAPTQIWGLVTCLTQEFQNAAQWSPSILTSPQAVCQWCVH